MMARHLAILAALLLAGALALYQAATHGAVSLTRESLLG